MDATDVEDASAADVDDVAADVLDEMAVDDDDDDDGLAAGGVSLDTKWPVDDDVADDTRLLVWLEDLDSNWDWDGCCWAETGARLLVCDEGCCKDERDVVVIVEYEEVEEENGLLV